MSKRGAETFGCHESVPAGAVPFFIPPKRQRGQTPPSPSHVDNLYSSSSDEMSDASDVDQSGAGVVAHLLAHAPSAGFQRETSHAAAPQHEQQIGVLGLLSPPACPEARQFLEQLVQLKLDGHLGGSTSDGYRRTPTLPCLGTALWHAFAELNTLLCRHFSELPTSMLRGYHSFTKAPRAMLWARFAAAQGAQGQEAVFGTPGCGPCHAVLLRFLLEHVLGAYPAASAVVYTIEVPAWLRGWCARWGHPAAGPMRVLALFAYAPAGAGAGAGVPPPAPRVLYIPCAE